MRRLPLHQSEVWLLLFVLAAFFTTCFATGCGGHYEKPATHALHIYATFRPNEMKAA